MVVRLPWFIFPFHSFPTSIRNEGEQLRWFCDFLASLLERRTHFELAQAYMDVFLTVGARDRTSERALFCPGSRLTGLSWSSQVHGETILQFSSLEGAVAQLASSQVRTRAAWAVGGCCGTHAQWGVLRV